MSRTYCLRCSPYCCSVEFFNRFWGDRMACDVAVGFADLNVPCRRIVRVI